MKAVVQTVYGDADVLAIADVPAPTPGARDLLVRVHAVSINPVDTKVRGGGRAGQPVPDPPQILGWDAAGVVEAVGTDATLFAPGDEVFFAGDVTRPGSYAEFVAVDERIVGRKPSTLSFTQAAAVPLTALTAWEGFFEQMGIKPEQDRGKPILIVGGGGGVGSIAVQIAKQVAGLHVIATASRPESSDYARRMGADAILDHRHDYRPQLEELGLDGVPYIFSSAPLTNFDQMVSCLRPLGTICCILSGAASQSLDVSALFPIRGTLTFELMFTRPRLGIDLEQQGQILNRVADLLDDGTLATTMTQQFDWTNVQQAHRALEAGNGVGKIVMTVSA